MNAAPSCDFALLQISSIKKKEIKTLKQDNVLALPEQGHKKKEDMLSSRIVMRLVFSLALSGWAACGHCFKRGGAGA